MAQAFLPVCPVFPVDFPVAAVLLTADGSLGIGTTNPQYLPSVNGQIGAKDVIVTNTGWSHYIFQPGFRLQPLSEVNKYIQANHHLPDIPTEAEVKEKGVSVGEMQTKLLAKVEELRKRKLFRCLARRVDEHDHCPWAGDRLTSLSHAGPFTIESLYG